ncbi:MAG: CBS domain-containing protein [Deltaproteobacteria bacterium]|nr:MAG: CBS domain-containing protein [Deltaproteobacteria bacterium]
MPYEKKVQDLMIPLENYPHVPYWFTLDQAAMIIWETAIKFEGSFEPRALLVFDERYHLLGILTLKDIVRGLEGDLLQGPGSESLSWKDLVGPELKKQSQKQVSEFMSPFKVTVNIGDSLVKAVSLMVKENVERIPVLADNKVAGMIRLADLFREISQVLLEKETL